MRQIILKASIINNISLAIPTYSVSLIILKLSLVIISINIDHPPIPINLVILSKGLKVWIIR